MLFFKNYVNCIYRLFKKEWETIMTFTHAMQSSHDARHWPITNLLIRWYAALTQHHALHAPEHVGPYAGSLLERRDWDHS